MLGLKIRKKWRYPKETKDEVFSLPLILLLRNHPTYGHDIRTCDPSTQEMDKILEVMASYTTAETLGLKADDVLEVAVMGKTGTEKGKSYFVNKIRGVQKGDEDEAEVGSAGHATRSLNRYIMKKTLGQKLDIAITDTPGYDMPDLTDKDSYIKIQISQFDLILIFYKKAVSEEDIWLAKHIQDCGVSFVFVKTHFGDIIDEYSDQTMKYIRKMREGCENALEKGNITATGMCYFISRNHMVGDFSLLKHNFFDKPELTKWRSRIHRFSLFSKRAVEKKRAKILSNLLSGRGIASAFDTCKCYLPRPGFDLSINVPMIQVIVLDTLEAFYIEDFHFCDMMDSINIVFCLTRRSKHIAGAFFYKYFEKLSLNERHPYPFLPFGLGIILEPPWCIVIDYFNYGSYCSSLFTSIVDDISTYVQQGIEVKVREMSSWSGKVFVQFLLQK